MKVIEIIKGEKPSLSFEVFPPKTDAALESVRAATEAIAAIHPSYMSVTYGAAGTNAGFAVEIASHIQNTYHVPTIAHLTCVGATEPTIDARLAQMQKAGIQNILALRGDLPAGMERASDRFLHASDLVTYIKSKGDFCVGGACYPDGHIESANQKEDILNLKKKVDAGCEFLTTQMFFDNNLLYTYLYKLREAGITVPIIPGIMPVTNAAQVSRIGTLSGTYLPQRFKQIVDHYGNNPSAMMQAGIAYATDQIIDLFANGIQAVHVYSMNKPEVAVAIQRNLSEIIK